MRRTFIALFVVFHGVAAQASPEVVRGFQAIDAWQLGEAQSLALDVYEAAPQDPLTLALMAEVKLHLGDYAGAIKLFEEARAGGAPDAVLRDIGFAEAAQRATEGYDEVVGEHFIVRHGPGRDAILVPYAMETLEAARERIGALFGWKPEARVVVELYPAASTLAAVSSLTKDEIANSGTIALCRWNRLMVTSPRAVVFGYSWRDTLAHELTHWIIGGASRNTVPIWLHEGLAKYAETAWRGEAGLGLSVEQQEALVAAAKKNQLIPFARMHPSMAKLKSQDETSLAFAEVFTFIEFLIAEKGWEGIRNVLARLELGATPEEAVAAVYGEPLASLEKRWQKGLKARPVRRDPKRGKAVEPKVVLKDRADAPDDALHGLGQRGRRFARAADLLFARGRVLAAKLELEKAYAETKSPLISAKLALVALAANDLSGAEKAARAAIDGNVDLAGPNVTLAEILVRGGKTKEAREPLARAIDVNPFDPRIHSLMLSAHDDPKMRAQAEQALALLGQPRSAGKKPERRSLGVGGSLTIRGAPFLRVFLRRAGERDFIPTGLTTPTPPITLAPGRWELELVPPNGARWQEALEVRPAREGATQEHFIAGRS